MGRLVKPVIKSQLWPISGDLRKLLDYAGLYGLDTEGDEVSWEAIEKLKDDWGFEQMGDNGVGTGDVVSPKHWRVVPDPYASGSPDDVIEAGSYEIIFWKPVSKEAKQLAKKANANPHTGSEFEFVDDQGNPRKLDRAHIWEIQGNKPMQPFDRKTIDRLLDVESAQT